MPSYNDHKQRLIDMARSGVPIPTRKSDPRLYGAFRDLTTPKRKFYEAELRSELEGLRPEWFWTKTRRLNEALLELARCGAERPGKGHPLQRIFECRTQATAGSDPDLAAELRRLAPHWFQPTARKAPQVKDQAGRDEELRTRAVAERKAKQLAAKWERELQRNAARAASRQAREAVQRERQIAAQRERQRRQGETKRAKESAAKKTRTPMPSDLKNALIERAQAGDTRPRYRDGRPLYQYWCRVRCPKTDGNKRVHDIVRELRPEWWEQPRKQKPPQRVDPVPRRQPAPLPERPSTPPEGGIPDRFPVLPPAELPLSDTRHADQLAAVRSYAGTGRGLLLDLARTGQPPPASGPLAALWRRCGDPQAWDFDQAFWDLLREVRPGWR